MRTLLSGGAPSDAYAASIGVSRGSKLGVEAPRQLNREEVRAVVTADRVTAALGGTELADRVQKARPFEPRMLTCVSLAGRSPRLSFSFPTSNFTAPPSLLPHHHYHPLLPAAARTSSGSKTRAPFSSAAPRTAPR